MPVIVPVSIAVLNVLPTTSKLTFPASVNKCERPLSPANFKAPSRFLVTSSKLYSAKALATIL